MSGGGLLDVMSITENIINYTSTIHTVTDYGEVDGVVHAVLICAIKHTFKSVLNLVAFVVSVVIGNALTEQRRFRNGRFFQKMSVSDFDVFSF